MTSTALSLARRWCHGHEIAGEPALSHALRVAQILHRHVPDAHPELLAAALVHDAPRLRPDERPRRCPVPPPLEGCHPHRPRADQHLDFAAGSHVPPTDPAVVVVSTADKVVSIGTVLDRAATSANPAAYWRQRHGFVAALPHFQSFLHAGTLHLPAAMADEFARLLDEAERTIRRCQMSGDGF